MSRTVSGVVVYNSILCTILVYNISFTHTQKIDPNTYWVVPGKLLAGEYPGARDSEEARRRLRRFLAAGVRHFIDLTEAGELEPYAELLAEEAGSRTSYERIPIRDGQKVGVGRTA